eukprot:15457840-Alexandrium_andersonii.AAC.1
MLGDQLVVCRGSRPWRIVIPLHAHCAQRWCICIRSLAEVARASKKRELREQGGALPPGCPEWNDSCVEQAIKAAGSSAPG